MTQSNIQAHIVETDRNLLQGFNIEQVQDSILSHIGIQDQDNTILEGMSRSYEPPYPKNMALLFQVSYHLKERNEKTKFDFVYPYTKGDKTITVPYKFDIRFFYIK